MKQNHSSFVYIISLQQIHIHTMYDTTGRKSKCLTLKKQSITCTKISSRALESSHFSPSSFSLCKIIGDIFNKHFAKENTNKYKRTTKETPNRMRATRNVYPEKQIPETGLNKHHFHHFGHTSTIGLTS